MAAYGLYLPDDVLNASRVGCLNVHPSLLPRYRGPSPVAAAILAGDEVTGVTVMEVTERVDSGPVVARRRLRMRTDETTGELTARLFHLGACLMVAVLPGWASGEIEATPQDDAEATMTRMLTRGDGEIDWTAPAERIARQVRAYKPWPGSFTRWDGRRLKVLEASASRADSGGVATGTVVAGLDGVPGVVTGRRRAPPWEAADGGPARRGRASVRAGPGGPRRGPARLTARLLESGEARLTRLALLRLESRHAYSNQAKRRPGRISRRTRSRADAATASVEATRCGRGGLAGERREVGQSELHPDGPAAKLAALQVAADALAEPVHQRQQEVRVVRVAGERRLGADRLALPLWPYGLVVRADPQPAHARPGPSEAAQ